MKIKKSIVLILTLSILILVIGACSGANSQTETSEDNSEPEPTSSETEPASSETEQTSTEVFIPTKAVPSDLPVYPSAQLWSEIVGSGQGDWTWLYSTTASGNEIVEYFSDELTNMGFEIDENATLAIYEEFFVVTTDGTVSVYWLATDEDGTTPDTKNRGYGIIVDVDAWEAKG